MINMNIGTPLRCVTPGDRRKVWAFKDFLDNCGDFGVKGTSLGKNSVLPKVSQRSRFGENSRLVQRPRGLEQLQINSHFKNSLTPKENETISKLEKPNMKKNLEIIKHIENSHLERKDIKVNRKLYSTRATGNCSQSAKQKAYLRMVFSRFPREHSKSNGNNFDKDYISLDDEFFSRYLTGGSEIQHSSFVPTNVRSAEIATEMRLGVKSGKCRLRRKYGDLGVTVPDNYFVKYVG